MKTASELIAHLTESGTPRGTTDMLAEFSRYWAKENGGKEPGANVLLEQLVAADITEGTIKKAGEFIYGGDFSPTTYRVEPEDEKSALREEIIDLKQQLRESESARAQLALQCAGLRGQLNGVPMNASERMKNLEGPPKAGKLQPVGAGK